MGLLLPSSCILCENTVLRAFSLCKLCENDFPVLMNACKQCALPLGSSNEGVDTVCGSCLSAPPHVDYTVSLYHYEAPIDYLITTLKYEQQLPHAAILGHLLLERLQRKASHDLPECIIPVPLYKNRLVKRGFNQSLEIARPISKSLDIPIESKIVYRTRQTLAQADLDAKQRRKNIQGCFGIQSSKVMNYQHVVIIDDVITTGSTINELAKQLKLAGVQKVGVWSIARAILGV